MHIARVHRMQCTSHAGPTVRQCMFRRAARCIRCIQLPALGESEAPVGNADRSISSEHPARRKINFSAATRSISAVSPACMHSRHQRAESMPQRHVGVGDCTHLEPSASAPQPRGSFPRLAAPWNSGPVGPPIAHHSLPWNEISDLMTGERDIWNIENPLLQRTFTPPTHTRNCPRECAQGT